MPKQFNRDIANKFVDILNKIGRKTHRDDPAKVVIYIALSEYINAIEADILQEPHKIISKDGELVDNPNKLILEISKFIKELLDKSLQLSLWDKEVGKEAEAKVRTFFR